MYNRELVTDFIFDGGLHSFTFNTTPVSRDGNWGMADRSGNIVLPFMFEDLLRIDEETAYARIGGRYGILDLQATINNHQP